MTPLQATWVPPQPLNESPSEKEGKSGTSRGEIILVAVNPSMKVPPKRKGNFQSPSLITFSFNPSMKVPPKRKGNPKNDETEDRKQNPQ